VNELRATTTISRERLDRNRTKEARDVAIRDMILELATELEKYVKVEVATMSDGSLRVSGRIYIARPEEVRRVTLPGIGVAGFGNIGAEIIEPIDPVPTYSPDKAASDAHVAKLLRVAVRKIQKGGA